MLLRGISKLVERNAQRILLRASKTVESGIPTIVIPGMPSAIETSTVTGNASTPRIQAA